MSEIDVRIITLPPMRVICFNGYGPNPEEQAYTKTAEWLKANDMWQDREERRFFGYNNPDPSPDSPNYGYDVWVTAEEDIDPGEEGRIIEFPGGLFAATHVDAGPQGEGIYDTWQRLAAWVENSKYSPDFDNRQWLEESPDPFKGLPEGFALDLYEPIR